MTTLTVMRLRERQDDTQRVHARIVEQHPEGRPLWAMPAERVLLAQADTPTRLSPRLVAEHIDREVAVMHDGDRITLSLIANPTWAEAASGTRGRVRVLPPDGWEGWLRRKLDDVVALDSVQSQRMRTAHGKRRGALISHLWVGYHATGFVIDADRLFEMQTQGVGRGRAYGCGLMLIRQADQ